MAYLWYFDSRPREGHLWRFCWPLGPTEETAKACRRRQVASSTIASSGASHASAPLKPRACVRAAHFPAFSFAGNSRKKKYGRLAMRPYFFYIPFTFMASLIRSTALTNAAVRIFIPYFSFVSQTSLNACTIIRSNFSRTSSSVQ